MIISVYRLVILVRSDNASVAVINFGLAKVLGNLCNPIKQAARGVK
jgi:hypothetical protein